jgi:hypothetical protein
MSPQQDLAATLIPIRDFYYKMTSTEEMAMCLAMSIEHIRDAVELCRGDKEWNTKAREMCALVTMSKFLIERLRHDQECLGYLISEAQNQLSSEQAG